MLHGIARELDRTNGNRFSRPTFLQNQLPTIVRQAGASRARTPDQTASRILQELRDDGIVDFLGNGDYRADRREIVAHLSLDHPFNNLDVGAAYTRGAIAPLAMAYGYGKLTAGITPKGTFPATESVVIFADVGGGRYGNFWDPDTGDLMYVGEDDSRTFGKDAREQDQNHAKGKNKALTFQRDLGHPIFLFTRETGIDPFTYQGLVEVREFDYFLENGRRVVRYRMRRLNVSSAVIDYQCQAEAERMLRFNLSKPPVLEEPKKMVAATSLRPYRSRVFSSEVRQNYCFSCAVCGEERYNYKDHAEVDAAHIFPVARNGSNDVRNGLALCKFHHWAFDGHLFFIDERHRIVPTACGIDVGGVQEFSNDRLATLPANPRERPHRLFLRERMQLVPAFLRT